MITGDNVYIAIETAIRSGIIDRTQEVVVIEGRDQNPMNTNFEESDLTLVGSTNLESSVNIKVMHFDGRVLRLNYGSFALHRNALTMVSTLFLNIPM